MGFQMLPIGLGWREFSSTHSTHNFDCPNPLCKGQGGGQLQLRSARNWATLFYVPLIPMNSLGLHARCSACKTMFTIDMLDSIAPELFVDLKNGALPPKH